MESNNSGILFDVYIDTEEDVLAIRDKARQLILEGKTVMEWGGEGTTSKKSFVMNPADVLMETRLFLKRLNPQKYGFISNASKMIRY